jgi:hypothetical protein
VKITRPNMADLSRTFASSGESDSKAPPEVSIDMPASILPVMEFCRPVSRLVPASTTAPQDESISFGINVTVAAGGPALSAPIFTLRRGVWRIVVNATLICTPGAVPTGDNHAILAMVGPEGVFGVGLALFMPTSNTPVFGQNDFLIHVPSDEWAVVLELTDPVTATAINRLRGSVYACHLL